MTKEDFIIAGQNGDLDKIKQAENISEISSFQDEYGRTPLHYACWNGQYEIVKFFNDSEAINPNKQDEFGFTPLHLTQFEHKDYRPGPEDYYKDDWARNPGEKGFPGNVPIREYRFAKIEIKNKPEITKLLIKSGADVNSYNQFGCTPLHYAASNGDVDVLKLLIENGSDVNAENIRQANPLFDAVSYGKLEAVKVLAEKGSDINNKTTNEGCPVWISSSSPLYEACHRGFFDIVKYLIEKGANVNQKNDDHNSPLLTAIGGGYNGEYKKDIITLLLENGADININVEGEYGETPLLRAIDRADYEILQELFNRGAKIPDLRHGNNLLHYFVARRAHRSIDGMVILNKGEVNENNVQTFKILLNKNYDVNSQNEEGETPLNLIADSDDSDMVGLLLRAGADPNIANKNGITPLQKACLANKFGPVRLLVSNGAELKAGDKFAKTPLQCTKSWKIKFYLLFGRYFY